MLNIHRNLFDDDVIIVMSSVYRTQIISVLFSPTVFTARAYVRAVLGVVTLSIHPSVCPSVTRVDCDKTK